MEHKGLKQVKECVGNGIEVNDRVNSNNIQNSSILSVVLYLEKRPLFKNYFPSNELACFNSLCVIYKYSKLSCKSLGKILSFGSANISIPILLHLGLIKQIGKPRLIIPFGAYKIDKGYVITPQGEKVLREILT